MLSSAKWFDDLADAAQHVYICLHLRGYSDDHKLRPQLKIAVISTSPRYSAVRQNVAQGLVLSVRQLSY